MKRHDLAMTFVRQLAALAALLTMSEVAWGDTFTYKGTNNANWSASGSWDKGAAPGSADTAFMTNSASGVFNVNFDPASATIDAIEFARGPAWQVTGAGRILTVNSSFVYGSGNPGTGQKFDRPSMATAP